jgi:Arc/MetJ-type ribon-helix-helix transcriptional regulator
MSEATINLPPRLAELVRSYVQAGWFPDLNTLVIEALRRYLETHQIELTEHFIREDVEWGLHGND